MSYLKPTGFNEIAILFIRIKLKVVLSFLEKNASKFIHDFVQADC